MDGIPVVLMEAAASGLPLISTELSGISELIINGTNGWILSIEEFGCFELGFFKKPNFGTVIFKGNIESSRIIVTRLFPNIPVLQNIAHLPTPLDDRIEKQLFLTSIGTVLVYLRCSHFKIILLAPVMHIVPSFSG